jgi:transcriptional regulator with XRE-family HTH domain/DNA-binding XRE family transcriptional regulator
MNQSPLTDNDPLRGDPLAVLTRRMRQLRHNSGKSYESMARAIFRSKTALATADKGERVPNWNVVADYVRACGGDPAEFEPAWRAAANQRRAPRQRVSNPPRRPAPGGAVDAADYVRLLVLLRESAGLAIREVSERTGQPKSTLSDWLGGRRLWPREVTERYLRACGLDDATAASWLAVYDRIEVAAEFITDLAPGLQPGDAEPAEAKAAAAAAAEAAAEAAMAEAMAGTVLPDRRKSSEPAALWWILAVTAVVLLILALT